MRAGQPTWIKGKEWADIFNEALQSNPEAKKAWEKLTPIWRETIKLLRGYYRQRSMGLESPPDRREVTRRRPNIRAVLRPDRTTATHKHGHGFFKARATARWENTTSIYPSPDAAEACYAGKGVLTDGKSILKGEMRHSRGISLLGTLYISAEMNGIHLTAPELCALASCALPRGEEPSTSAIQNEINKAKAHQKEYRSFFQSISNGNGQNAIFKFSDP